MPRLLSAFFSVLALASSLAPAGFEDDFGGGTLRVDYTHTGNSAEEHFALRRVVIEGPWPGSRARLIDTSNLG